MAEMWRTLFVLVFLVFLLTDIPLSTASLPPKGTYTLTLYGLTIKLKTEGLKIRENTGSGLRRVGCHVRSMPGSNFQPIIQSVGWYFNGQRITNGSLNITLQEGLTSTISGITFDSIFYWPSKLSTKFQGNYECIAGQDSVNFTVDIQTSCPPINIIGLNTTTVNRTVEGEHIAVGCDDNFAEVGEKITSVTCQDNRTYTRFPTCRSWCPAINSSRLNMTSINATISGTTLPISCASQYLQKGSPINSVTCQDSGKWTPLPTCHDTCPVINITGVSIPTPLRSHIGDVLAVSCESDYAPVGKAITSARCQAHGNWTELPTCAVACPRIISAELNMTTTSRLVNGTTLAIGCAANYIQTGSRITSVTCQSNRSWTKFPTCQLTCPPITSTLLQSTKSSSRSRINTTLPVSCVPGYELVNKLTAVPSVTCQPNGTWTSFPQCQDIIDCPGACKDSNSVCKDAAGSYQCSCAEGYTGTGAVKNSCADVNECETECLSVNVKCNNTLGSYICACPDGSRLASGQSEKDCISISGNQGDLSSGLVAAIAAGTCFAVLVAFVAGMLLLTFKQRAQNVNGSKSAFLSQKASMTYDIYGMIASKLFGRKEDPVSSMDTIQSQVPEERRRRSTMNESFVSSDCIYGQVDDNPRPNLMAQVSTEIYLSAAGEGPLDGIPDDVNDYLSVAPQEALNYNNKADILSSGQRTADGKNNSKWSVNNQSVSLKADGGNDGSSGYDVYDTIPEVKKDAKHPLTKKTMVHDKEEDHNPTDLNATNCGNNNPHCSSNNDNSVIAKSEQMSGGNRKNMEDVIYEETGPSPVVQAETSGVTGDSAYVNNTAVTTHSTATTSKRITSSVYRFVTLRSRKKAKIGKSKVNSGIAAESSINSSNVDEASLSCSKPIPPKTNALPVTLSARHLLEGENRSLDSLAASTVATAAKEPPVQLCSQLSDYQDVPASTVERDHLPALVCSEDDQQVYGNAVSEVASCTDIEAILPVASLTYEMPPANSTEQEEHNPIDNYHDLTEASQSLN